MTDYDDWADETPDHATRSARNDTPAERIERWINAHPSRAYAVRFPVDDVRTVLAENERLANAVEQLNALILRALPNDGSYIPQPDDPWWRAQLDGIVDEAAVIYVAAMRSER